MPKEVTEKTMFLDAEGKPHNCRSMAEHRNLEIDMIEAFSIFAAPLDVHDIINLIDSNRVLVRQYLIAGEKMEQEVLSDDAVS